MALRDRSSASFRRRHPWRRTALGILVGLLACGLAAALDARTSFPIEGLPYVLAVLAATLVGNLIAGTVAVVVSTLLLDYYSLPPLHEINARSPAELWGLVTFATVMVVTAQLVAWLEAVGDRERAERERVALIVRVGDAMSSAVGPDTALREVAQTLVPTFADWTAVHVAHEDGSIERVAAARSVTGDLERALLDASPPDPADERGVAGVIRTGRTDRSPLRAELGSSAVAPLTARERTFGALTVLRSRARPAFSDAEVSLLEEIAERTALVVDNMRLVDLERRSSWLNAVLQELTAALSASVSLDEVGRTVVEQGVRALSAAATAFAVRQPDGTVEIRHSYGHDPASVEEWGSFSIDDPMPLSQAMRIGRPIVLRTIEERDRRFPALRGVPPLSDHALVCLPFVVRGSAIGGLAVTFAGPRAFAPWELAFMESVAAQAGQALDRAMLFESERAANTRLETSADRLERLLMVAYRLSRAHERPRSSRSIVEVGVPAADASAGTLLLVDRATEELVLETSTENVDDVVARFSRLPLASPFAAAEAARTGHPVWIGNAREHAAMFPGAADALRAAGREVVAMAALPLVVAGQTLGVLVLAYDEEHAFDDDERDFLLTLAGLCGQNLQGALVLEEREIARAEAEEAREQIEFLAEATRVLSSSLDLDSTISELADLCVPRIADWLSVDIVDGFERRRLVLRHEDPEKLELLRRLVGRIPFEPHRPDAASRVLRTGESEVIEHVDDEMLKAAAPDPETLEMLRELAPTSVAMVPLVVQERVLGSVMLGHAGSGRHFGPGDVAFIEGLARRAAVAIENARLFRDREHMARALQRSLLPRHLPTIPGVELAVRYIPFGEGHDVGGDFYDVFGGLGQSWGLLIGDVCGKGPEAASIVGIARHTVRGLAMAHSRPSVILDALNRAILEESPWDRFCTACYVRLRPDGPGFRATVSLGGHLPPLVRSADGAIRQVGKPGSLLGVLEEPELSDAVVDLSPGDLLLLYTDGLEEPGAVADPFSTVETVLAESAGRSADAVADELLQRFRGDGGTPPRDDIAILAVRVVDPPNPT